MVKLFIALLIACAIAALYTHLSGGSDPPEEEDKEAKPEVKTAHIWELVVRFTGNNTNIYKCKNCQKLYEMKPWSSFDDDTNISMVYRQNEKEPYC